MLLALLSTCPTATTSYLLFFTCFDNIFAIESISAIFRQVWSHGNSFWPGRVPTRYDGYCCSSYMGIYYRFITVVLGKSSESIYLSLQERDSR